MTLENCPLTYTHARMCTRTHICAHTATIVNLKYCLKFSNVNHLDYYYYQNDQHWDSKIFMPKKCISSYTVLPHVKISFIHLFSSVPGYLLGIINLAQKPNPVSEGEMMKSFIALLAAHIQCKTEDNNQFTCLHTGNMPFNDGCSPQNTESSLLIGPDCPNLESESQVSFSLPRMKTNRVPFNLVHLHPPEKHVWTLAKLP